LQPPQQLSFLELHSAIFSELHAVAHSEAQPAFSSPPWGAKIHPAVESPPTTTRARRNFFIWLTFSGRHCGKQWNKKTAEKPRTY